jgi:hypothetical protein
MSVRSARHKPAGLLLGRSPGLPATQGGPSRRGPRRVLLAGRKRPTALASSVRCHLAQSGQWRVARASGPGPSGWGWGPGPEESRALRPRRARGEVPRRPARQSGRGPAAVFGNLKRGFSVVVAACGRFVRPAKLEETGPAGTGCCQWTHRGPCFFSKFQIIIGIMISPVRSGQVRLVTRPGS